MSRNRLLVGLLVAILAATVIPAGAVSVSPAQQQLIDTEAAWSKAMVQKDTTAIAGIIGDDWMGQNDGGKIEDKTGFLNDVKSGAIAVASMSNHDVHVRLMRNIAIVQGMDDEKSSYKGKDGSGTYSWMDVFEKRGGKWVAIASQVTKVSAMK